MRLIDADALEQVLSRRSDELMDEGQPIISGAALGAVCFVISAPTIDAVPVVRCKECEYYNITCCSSGTGWCENMDMGVSDDFYCANGAKITNKETGETYK